MKMRVNSNDSYSSYGVGREESALLSELNINSFLSAIFVRADQAPHTLTAVGEIFWQGLGGDVVWWGFSSLTKLVRCYWEAYNIVNILSCDRTRRYRLISIPPEHT